MKTRRTTPPVALFALSMLMSGACLAADNAAGADEAGARAANLARFDAAVRGDVAALDKLLADDLDYCHSNGECEGKRAYLASFEAGTMKYRSIEPTVDRFKLVGPVAVILGHAHVNATRNGADLNIDIGYTSVFAWREGRWQLTSWRSLTLPPAPPK
jgi:ketosteroid isomerase-like protein